MKKILVIAACVAASFSAHAASKVKEIKMDTLVVTTSPIMHCSGCENRIKSNIRYVKGTKDIETSVPEQKVTIIYKTKDASYEDYVKAFKKIGFDIKRADEEKEAE